jgi:hypothetical protein
MSAWLRRTYAILLAWSEAGENPDDHAELDQIRTEFDQSHASFARLLMRSGVAGSVGSGSRLRREIGDQLATAQEALSHAEEQRTKAMTRMAELEARAESESDRARNLEGELAAIQADAMAQLATAQEALSHAEEQRTKAMTRMAELEARAESESDRARNLEGELAAIQADAMAQRALTAERTLLLEERTAAALADAERQRDALRAANGHLREIEGDLHAAATQKAELAGRAAMAESTLAQRQEEIAQLFDRLVAAEARAAEARALLDEQHVGRSEDRAAIARLANELAESNVRLADLAREADARERRLQEVEEARTLAERGLAARFDEIANLTSLLMSETERHSETQAESNVRLADLAREADARERRLQEVEEARTLAERGLAARFDEIANLTSLLMSETGRHGEVQENVKWLRSMAEVAAGFPAWWTILPRRWREDRAHARYLRAGLFDAQRYRELNPDVAADGMDPVRHYIFHGIAEGRARP